MTCFNGIAFSDFFKHSSDEMIAMFSHDNFFPTASFSGGRAMLIPGSYAGLEIHHATSAMVGQYSVVVNALDSSGNFVTLVGNATVHVSG